MKTNWTNELKGYIFGITLGLVAVGFIGYILAENVIKEAKERINKNDCSEE